MRDFNKKWLPALLILALVAYIAGLFLNVIETDSCQYAKISFQMLRDKSFLKLYYDGGEYLDKPPLLFWLSCISFKIFGVSNFTFRLPSFLFSILGVYSTYRLATKLYDKNHGILATIILSTCQAFFLFNHDVRTDALLTANVIFAIWQLYEYLTGNKIINLVLGSFGVGLAMLSKGPIGLMIPVLAFVPDFIYRRQWKNFLRTEWLLGILILVIMLIPMVIGLYQQFGIEGPKFFFWKQSFGRLTGDQHLRNDPDPFFLFHSFLWAFLPWSIIAVYAVFDRLKTLILEIKNKFPRTEIFTLMGIILPFIALSRSLYQLPHYIFVLFPLFAIITAVSVEKLIDKRPLTLKVFSYVQLFVCVIIWSLSFVLFGYCFKGMNVFLWVIWILCIAAAIAFFFKGKVPLSKLIIPSAITIIGVNILLNFYFYPTILKYQASATAAEFIKQTKIPAEHVNCYHETEYMSADFYLKRTLASINDKMINDSLSDNKKLWLFTNSDGFKELSKRYKFGEVITFDCFHASILTIQFLNPKTRESAITKKYLVNIISLI